VNVAVGRDVAEGRGVSEGRGVAVCVAAGVGVSVSVAVAGGVTVSVAVGVREGVAVGYCTSKLQPARRRAHPTSASIPNLIARTSPLSHPLNEVAAMCPRNAHSTAKCDPNRSCP